ncbi:MAG: hypothetical protein FJW31_11615 [Acidobacteria bacterium]|nr:hypothetical protein [Acidobacteriota bacterium]
MLNLIFDWNAPLGNANARFNEFPTPPPQPGTNPPTISKAWLKATATDPLPVPDNPANWTLVGRDNTKLTAAVGDQIWVRVAGLNVPSNYMGRITILVARDDHGNAAQPWASPFALGGSNPAVPCTIFDTVGPNGVGTPLTASTAAGPWLGALGSIEQGPLQTGNNKFSVVVAATICASDWSGLKTYSHDPDMEVDI